MTVIPTGQLCPAESPELLWGGCRDAAPRTPRHLYTAALDGFGGYHFEIRTNEHNTPTRKRNDRRKEVENSSSLVPTMQ